MYTFYEGFESQSKNFPLRGKGDLHVSRTTAPSGVVRETKSPRAPELEGRRKKIIFHSVDRMCVCV